MCVRRLPLAAALALALAAPTAFAASTPPAPVSQITDSTGFFSTCSNTYDASVSSTPPPCTDTSVSGGANATGPDSLALGGGASATGAASVAVGVGGVFATGSDADAIGTGAVASGIDSVAIGTVPTASGDYAVAIGNNAKASSNFAVAIGTGSVASAGAVAIGDGAQADVGGTVSVGSDGANGIPAFQDQIVNVAPAVTGFGAVNLNQLDAGGRAIAEWIGGGAAFSGGGGGLFSAPEFVLSNPYTAGTYSDVGGAISALDQAVADIPISGGATTPDFGSNSPGAASDDNYSGAGANGASSLAAGVNAYAGDASDVAVGDAAFATGGGSPASAATAVGALAAAEAAGGTAVGSGASSLAVNAVAIGAGTLADAADTVSVGSDGADGIAAFQRRIVNVGNGIGEFDAVNVSQLNAGGSAIATWMGAGASFNGSGAGVFAPPKFVLTNPYTHGTYTTVSGALQALDTGLSDQAKAGGTGAGTGATGPQGPAGKNGVGVVQFTSVAHATARVGTSSAGPEQAKQPVVVQNVAAGTAGTDAVNVQQMKAGDKAASDAANAYTDSVTVEYNPRSDPTITLRGKHGTMIQNVEPGAADNDAATVGQVKAAENWAQQYTDQQVARGLFTAERYTNAMGAVLNRRIDYSLSSAMADAQAAAALAGQSRDEPNRVAVGTGYTAGVSAMNVTYQHLLPGSHWAFNVGASVSAGGGEQGTTVGGGVSYGW